MRDTAGQPPLLTSVTRGRKIDPHEDPWDRSKFAAPSESQHGTLIELGCAVCVPGGVLDHGGVPCPRAHPAWVLPPDNPSSYGNDDRLPVGTCRDEMPSGGSEMQPRPPAVARQETLRQRSVQGSESAGGGASTHDPFPGRRWLTTMRLFFRSGSIPSGYCV